MHRASRLASIAQCLAMCSAPAWAGTFIVDINNGPGAHFTDLPQAVAAVAPGDVLLVRGGLYTPVILTKGIAILGAPSRIHCCTGGFVVSVPAGQTAVIADLLISGMGVSSSAGTVVLDNLGPDFGYTAQLAIQHSADVRVHRFTSQQRMCVLDSRVELVSSTIVGQSSITYGGWGENALEFLGGSRLFVMRTSLRGGNALDVPIGIPQDGGNGGAGLFLGSPSANPPPTVLIAGSAGSVIQGGRGGWSVYGSPGEDGDGLENHMFGVWRSGVSFASGGIGGGVPVNHIPGPNSFDTVVAPSDPTLELVGTPTNGSTPVFRVVATPGSVVRLALGAVPIVQPTTGVRVDKLVSQDDVRFLGVMPGTGEMSYTVPQRSDHPRGTVLYAQAYVYDPVARESRRTNSVPLVMR